MKPEGKQTAELGGFLLIERLVTEGIGAGRTMYHVWNHNTKEHVHCSFERMDAAALKWYVYGIYKGQARGKVMGAAQARKEMRIALGLEPMVEEET